MIKFFRSIVHVQHDYGNAPDQHRATGLSRMVWGTAVALLLGQVVAFSGKFPKIFSGEAVSLGRTDTGFLLMGLIGVVGLVSVLLLLNRGRLTPASVAYVLMLYGVALLGYGLSKTMDAAILILTLPVVAAGVLLGRGGLAGTTVIAVLTIAGHAVLSEQGLLAGIATGVLTPTETIAYGGLILSVNSIILSVFAGGQRLILQRNLALTDKLAQSNQELQDIRASLEEHNAAMQSAVQEYVTRMAAVAQGNLSTRVTVRGNGAGPDDPLILLGRSLNDTITSLHQMTLQIHETGSSLGSTASEILAATSQQASGAGEQSAAITQATATIEEVRAIAEQTAQNADAVARVARQTAESSSIGREAVGKTAQGMEQVKQQVESIAAFALDLSEQAQAIGAIIATVKEIAAQSNMLALNAAVEAARAGEAGRGFAVVAQEVRSLAEQSRQATVQVEQLLSDIKHGVNAVVMATEQGMKGADAGVRLAAEAGAVIHQLTAGVTESAQAATQIAAAAGQQLVGMDQIATAMGSILQATTQSLAGVQQSKVSAGELNTLATQLRDLVEQYSL
jgi:methyl-accepting chemotaxis protein